VIAAALSLAVGGAAAALYGALEPNNSLFGPVTGRGPRDRRVYLTFDDGPNPGATPLILDTLARHGVTAAFFLVGAHVRRFPDLALAVAAGGHALGNHTDTHRKLHLAGPGRIASELDAAHRSIAAATGVGPRLFRAPHGYRNPFLLREARRREYRVVGWTFGVGRKRFDGESGLDSAPVRSSCCTTATATIRWATVRRRPKHSPESSPT
jgi:peptidoglycan/xylan/chitin deacetylase (PgdA/CDA1 family)